MVKFGNILGGYNARRVYFFSVYSSTWNSKKWIFQKANVCLVGGSLSFGERLFGVRGRGHNRFDTQKNRLSYNNLHTYNLLTKIIKKTFIIIKTNGLTIFYINTIISTTKLITISRAYNINI